MLGPEGEGMKKTAVLLVMWVTCVAPSRVLAIEVEDVLIQLVEEVHVPARQAGVIEQLTVREGQVVKQGTILARLEDEELRIDRDRTMMELEIATRNSRNDVRVRLASKALELAQAELQRALESVEKYSKSISQSEIDRSRLTVQRAQLEIEQATHDKEIAGITRQLKQTQLRAAEHQLSQRTIVSPLDGVVAEVSVHRGEWVTPGQRVLRILRNDRLRAQGFLPAGRQGGAVVGRRAILEVQSDAGSRLVIHGTIVFESEEVDPVDGQVMVWAEFENRDRQIRPGMRGRLKILEAESNQAPIRKVNGD